MKIGTISIANNAYSFNFGAYLQTWAFKTFLEKISYVDDVEVIDYKRDDLSNWNPYMPLVSYTRRKKKFLVHNTLKHYYEYWRKLIAFKSFAKKYMSLSSKRYYKQSKLNSAKLNYDVVICESDTIWTTINRGHYDRGYFLALESFKNMKRIAYAPSMGDAYVKESRKEELKNMLYYPQYISCRATYEVDVLKNYTEKEVTLVLDPVFLLDISDYSMLSDYVPTKNNYAVIYQPMSDSPSVLEAAVSYCKKYNLELYEISSSLGKKNKGIKTLKYVNPKDFCSIIRHSKVCFTNSFHASCFSLIFNVELYAFERGNCDLKVYDICSLFDIAERYFKIGEPFEEKSTIEYEKINQKINKYKKESIEWLENALKK